MRTFHTVRLVLFLMPGLLLAQAWRYTPPAYPAVCTNPAVVGEWTMDYETAASNALAQNKNLYLLVTGSTWCPDCDTLQRQVMAEPEMIDFMRDSDAYWVWLDLPSRMASNAVNNAGWLCHTNTGLFTLEQSEAILARNRSLEAHYGAFKGYRTPETLNMPTFVVCRPDGTYQGEVTHYRAWTYVTPDLFINQIQRIWNDDAWDVQDNAVPSRSDDDAPTATALMNIAEIAAHQSHTLSPTDFSDWYSFSAKPGKVYTFGTEGLLLEGQVTMPAGQVNIEIFTETNADALPVASAFGPLEQPQTVTWSLNQATSRKVYVRVSGIFAERAGYAFAYSQVTVAPPPASSLRKAEGAVVDMSDCSRVTGVLTFSVTKAGVAKAKYRTRNRTLSFSQKKFWTTFDESGVLTSTFSSGSYQLVIQMPSVDEVYAVIRDPDYAQPLTARLSVSPWSAANPATAFLGYYTVALIPGTVTGDHAPTGYSYMTIFLKSVSAKTGKVTYAGKLADGTGYSGSAVLEPLENGLAQITIFTRSGKHHLSGLLSIASPLNQESEAAPGAVTACGGVQPYWSYVSGRTETAFDMTLDVAGLYYSRGSSLRDHFDIYQAEGTTALIAVGTVPESAVYGVATALPLLPLAMFGEQLKIQPSAYNPTRTRLSVNRTTGIFKGSIRIPFMDAVGRTKNVTAAYAGVLMPGVEASDGCDLGCGLSPVGPEVYFGMGAYRFRDKASVGVGAHYVPFTAGYPILIGNVVQ